MAASASFLGPEISHQPLLTVWYQGHLRREVIYCASLTDFFCRPSLKQHRTRQAVRQRAPTALGAWFMRLSTDWPASRESRVWQIELAQYTFSPLVCFCKCLDADAKSYQQAPVVLRAAPLVVCSPSKVLEVPGSWWISRSHEVGYLPRMDPFFAYTIAWVKFLGPENSASSSKVFQQTG